MAVDSLWIRLNIDWDRVKWIRSLPRATRNVWPDLLRWIKMNSPGKGYIAFVDFEALAYDLRYDEDEYPLVEQLVKAAIEGGALSLNGNRLQVVAWDEYQDPETIRKRKYKEQTPVSETSAESAQIRAEEKSAENSGLSAQTETRQDTDKTKTVITVCQELVTKLREIPGVARCRQTPLSEQSLRKLLDEYPWVPDDYWLRLCDSAVDGASRVPAWQENGTGTPTPRQVIEGQIVFEKKGGRFPEAPITVQIRTEPEFKKDYTIADDGVTWLDASGQEFCINRWREAQGLVAV